MSSPERWLRSAAANRPICRPELTPMRNGLANSTAPPAARPVTTAPPPSRRSSSASGPSLRWSRSPILTRLPHGSSSDGRPGANTSAIPTTPKIVGRSHVCMIAWSPPSSGITPNIRARRRRRASGGVCQYANATATATTRNGAAIMCA